MGVSFTLQIFGIDMMLLYIDLFCGAGGTSSGVNSARLNGKQCATVIACVNHDKNAIASHIANHPKAMHFTEDIRTLELSPLKTHIESCRRQYPDALLVLWASLECTNFSKAKGGMPRDADSRTLAEHLFRYIEAINPDYIQIENVEEFMSWGEVDKNGKPISMDKGKSYLCWVRNVKKYGYDFDYRILNSADYGAYTSRKRFFGIFAKQGLPISFPEATHCKDHHAFISAYYGNGHNHSVDAPSPTLTTKDRLSLILTEHSEIANIIVYDTDSPMTTKIKEFMALYGIIDVKMRMLKVSELKKIMGFSEDYVLIGTQSEQKKYIGNAVEVTIARRWCEALCAKLKDYKYGRKNIFSKGISYA